MSVVDYDFTAIGTDGFERLAQRLAMTALGNHVKPTGVGGDGGRDCTFDGPVDYAGRTGRWDGYGVIQIKHRARDVDTSENRTWVKNQITKEISRWIPKDGQKLNRRLRRPTYYLFMTNATLSPDGQDTCLDHLRELCEEAGILDCDLWSRAEVSRLLDDAPSIRQTYLHIILPGDIVAALQATGSQPQADLATHLTVSALRELGERQWARLSDSGIQSEERLRLSTVAVDLACSREGTEHPQPTLRTALILGDQDLRPSEEARFKGILLTGGPGQGKSTVAQLLCQIYRTSFVQESSALLPKQRDLLLATTGAISRMNLEPPIRRRWPVYVDLSKFGDAVAADSSRSLLSFIASQTSVQGRSIYEPDLIRWRSTWPWAVVLDGLDEVAHPAIREQVAAAIEEFISDCRASNANVLFFATTRPQGYHGELAGLDLDELTLDPLSPTEALEYGSLLANTRYDDDRLSRERIVARLKEASESPVTSRLMSTPLQVTIMSTLLERATRVPDTRHALFDAYYAAIYSREQVKASSLGRILTKYRAVVDFAHEQVALYLHVQAQNPGSAESLLDSSKLAQLIEYRLLLDEHDDHDARRLAREIITATRNRVVLLVGKRGDLLGYEVRPIQEYFAARALTSGSETEIISKVEKLIPVSHWRNTLLLAFGRLESHSNPRVPDNLLSLCVQADSVTPLALEVGPGRRLAQFLLADSFATNVPRLRRALLKHALESLDHWPDATAPELRKVLGAEMEADRTSQDFVKQALAQAADGSVAARASAFAVLARWTSERGVRGTVANSIRTQLRISVPDRELDHRVTNAGESLRRMISADGLTSSDTALLENILRRFERWGYQREVPLGRTGSEHQLLLYAGSALPDELLASGEVTARVLGAIRTMPEGDADLAIILREQLIALLEEQPADASDLLANEVLTVLDR